MRISEWSSNVCSSDLAKALNGRNAVNDDQRRGIDIVRRALQAPLRQIAENAGHDGGVVAGRFIDGNDENLGFNAQTEQYENLFQSGVIDPNKVVRTAPQDAATVAGLLITTVDAVRSDGRRMGNECVRTFRTGCAASLYTKKTI